MEVWHVRGTFASQFIPTAENNHCGTDLCIPAAKVYSFASSFHLEVEKEEAAEREWGGGREEGRERQREFNS